MNRSNPLVASALSVLLVGVPIIAVRGLAGPTSWTERRPPFAVARPGVTPAPSGPRVEVAPGGESVTSSNEAAGSSETQPVCQIREFLRPQPGVDARIITGDALAAAVDPRIIVESPCGTARIGDVGDLARRLDALRRARPSRP